MAFYDGEMKDLELGPNYIRHISFQEEASRELVYFLVFLVVYVVLLSAVLWFVLYEQNFSIEHELMKLKRMGWSMQK